MSVINLSDLFLNYKLSEDQDNNFKKKTFFLKVKQHFIIRRDNEYELCYNRYTYEFLNKIK